MKTISQVISKYSPLIMLVILVICAYNFTVTRNENVIMKNELNHKTEKIDFYRNKIALENSILGDDFKNMFTNDLVSIINSHFIGSPMKILIIADNKSCQPCYQKIAESCSQLSNNIDIFLLIPSRNLEYAVNLKKQVNDKINVIVDSSFTFLKKYPTIENVGAIILLDMNYKCVYSKVYDRIYLSEDHENILEPFEKLRIVNQ